MGENSHSPHPSWQGPSPLVSELAANPQPLSMTSKHAIASLSLLALLSACGGGGGGQAVATGLPGAIRLQPVGISPNEYLVATSTGQALGSDILLAGAYFTDANPGLVQARLDNQGELLGAFMAEITDPVVSALLAQRVEHRGDAVAFTSPAHVWGGVRQVDGGWCGMLDLTAGKSILDSVLFEGGGVGVLLYEGGPGAGEATLTYEEYLADGTPSFTVELPGPFLVGPLPSMGLVSHPSGLEYPVIVGSQVATTATWVGMLNRTSGGVDVTTSLVAAPVPLVGLEVIDAPGSDSAWIVGSRESGTTPLVEVLEVRTTDDQGAPLPFGPEVARSRVVGFPAGLGYVGIALGSAVHGAELGAEFQDLLFLSGVTEDETTGDLYPCWFAWERGLDFGPWARVAVGVTAAFGGEYDQIIPSPNPGRVATAAYVENSGSTFSTIVNEFDAATGVQTAAASYDTLFAAQDMRRVGEGIALSRVTGLGGLASQVEWIAGDLGQEFSFELRDGATDELAEFQNPMGAYPDRALLAGGSTDGLYVISMLDPVARAQASGILTESPPELGPEEAFYSANIQSAGIEVSLVPLGIQNTTAVPTVITPAPPTPLEVTITDL